MSLKIVYENGRLKRLSFHDDNSGLSDPGEPAIHDLGNRQPMGEDRWCTYGSPHLLSSPAVQVYPVDGGSRKIPR